MKPRSSAGRRLDDGAEFQIHERFHSLQGDTNRLNRLRQDPSVVSLLNMYDDKGRLDERAFSNTPRANKLQRESTFKELLALSDTPETDSKETSFEEGEGDFSWAERFIA